MYVHTVILYFVHCCGSGSVRFRFQIRIRINKSRGAGLSLWREDNPVHLTAAVYGDIAVVIYNQAETSGKNPQAGHARRRLVSVVPTLVSNQPVAREPGWISGQLRPARGGQHGNFRAVESVAGSGGGGAVAPGEALASIRIRSSKMHEKVVQNSSIVKRWP